MIRITDTSKMENVSVDPIKRQITLFTDSTFENVLVHPAFKMVYMDYSMPKHLAVKAKKMFHPKNRVLSACFDLVYGLQDQFPLCCVLAFCWDALQWNKNSIPSGIKRGVKHTKRGVAYVPCRYHSSTPTLI